MRRFIPGGKRRALVAVLAMALSVGAVPVLASPAGADEAMTLRSVWFETRPWNGAVPSSASSAVATFNGLPTGSGGYCATQVAALAGASNQTVCEGTNSWIGYHASMAFDVAAAGQWRFRLGPDFGGGGALLVDGAPIDFHSYDSWWGFSWENPAVIFQGSINLGVGNHVFELYGFDDCCDGPWGAQLQAPGGEWTDIAGVSTTPSLRPQTIVFGSNPPPAPQVGDTYQVATTGGASGQPVVLSLGAGAGSVCTLSGSTVTRLRAGTCTILANQAGVTEIYSPAAEASQSWTTPDEAPSVAVTGVDDGGTYEIHAVPAAACAVSDTEDGVVPVTPLLSAVDGPKAAFGIGSQTATCTYTDQGSNTGTATATYTIVDTIRPTLAGSPTSAANGAGWYHGPVTIHWTATDAGTGIATPPADSVIDAEGAALVASTTVADNAGNTTTADSPSVAIDRTAPSVTYTGVTTYTVDQTVSIGCTASDTLSGLASNTCANVQGPASGFNAGDNTRSATATDKAGNVGSTSVTFRVTVTFDSLCTLSVRYADGALGNSLCAKLSAAAASAARGNTKAKANQLDAYRNEVSAQSGKKLTVAEAATLTRLSNLL
ncbi:MAG: exported protein of unknown function [Actinomycetia bacterium]|nr:exported protein of unknown function [Actinomycetes bacterium]